MLIINFEGREAKGLSKGRYDETFDGEDAYTTDVSDTVTSCMRPKTWLHTKYK